MAIELQVNGFSNCNLLAMPVGIKQKSNVNATVQKVIHLCFMLFNILSREVLPLISLTSVSCREFYNYSIPLRWQRGWVVGSRLE